MQRKKTKLRNKIFWGELQKGEIMPLNSTVLNLIDEARIGREVHLILYSVHARGEWKTPIVVTPYEYLKLRNGDFSDLIMVNGNLIQLKLTFGQRSISFSNFRELIKESAIDKLNEQDGSTSKLLRFRQNFNTETDQMSPLMEEVIYGPILTT